MIINYFVQGNPPRPRLRFIEDFGDDGLVASESKPTFRLQDSRQVMELIANLINSEHLIIGENIIK